LKNSFSTAQAQRTSAQVKSHLLRRS